MMKRLCLTLGLLFLGHLIYSIDLPLLETKPFKDSIYQITGKWQIKNMDNGKTIIGIPNSRIFDHDNPRGVYNFQAKLKIPPHLLGKNISIYFSELKLAAIIKIGDAIATMGSFSLNQESYRANEIPVYIDLGIINKDSIDISIDIANFEAREGGITDDYYIGLAEEIHTQNRNELLFAGILFGLMMFGFVYHIVIYFINQQEKSSLILSIICIMQAFKATTDVNFLLGIFVGLGFNWEFLKDFFEYLNDFTLGALFIMYFNAIYPNLKSIIFSRINLLYTVLVTLYIFILPNYIQGQTWFFIFGYLWVIVAIVYCTRISIKALKLKSPGSTALFISIIFLSFVSVLDILSNEDIITLPELVPIAMVLFLSYQSSIISYIMRANFKSIAQSKEVATRSNQLKLDIIGKSSHELRNPLNSITALTENLLLDDSLSNSPEAREIIQVIHKSSIRMNHVVSAMIADAIKDHQENRFQPGLFNIMEVMERIMILMTPMAQRTNLEFKLTQSHPIIKVWADEEKIEQILINLISNALKYTRIGSVRIYVNASQERGQTEVIIKDTGPGMPSHILEAWNKDVLTLKPGLSEVSSGVGLGLSIVKNILDIHGIHMFISSHDGLGTTFSFCLPMNNEKIQ